MASRSPNAGDIDRALELFVQKAEKLRNSGFRARIMQLGGIHGHTKWDVKTGFSESFEGPTEEEIDAFILTFRFFIQDNEPISIKNMDDLLGSLSVDIPAVENFHKSRANLNQALDAPIGMVIDGEKFTRRNVLWTMIYGDLSHADPAHEERVKGWLSNPLTGMFIRMEFLTALMTCLSAIDVLARNVQKVIAHRLRFAKTPSARSMRHGT